MRGKARGVESGGRNIIIEKSADIWHGGEFNKQRNQLNSRPVEGMAEQHFKIESTKANPTLPDVSKDTAHLISNDAWYQVGFALITALNSAFVLGYSRIMMVPLGWIGGTVGSIAAASISLYANHLLARLHETGGRRHIRYRDLAGHIYGKYMYYITWTLQYINLFMANIGCIILAGQALKGIYTTYSNEDVLKLPYCIIITGVICIIFAFSIPHLSALKWWLGISTLLSLTYVIISVVLSTKDGINRSKRDYGIPGSMTTKIYSGIGAATSFCFAYNTGMLPELQATVKPPYIRNMQRALYLEFTAGLVPFYTVIFLGYWAYGSSTSSYILDNVHGPKWIKTLANTAACLQTVVTLQIFASPTYEYLDTKFVWRSKSTYSMRNWVVRLIARGTYLGVSTFIAALLPFLGDFVNLTSAIALLPLTFVLSNHMYIKVKGNDLNALQKSWHWLNVCFFSLFSVAGAVTAFHQIVMDSKTYHIFADL